ncbi:unnamed protein product [Colias eurytheme]|nr:unnamed protein product [Colias eurytheme]
MSWQTTVNKNQLEISLYRVRSCVMSCGCVRQRSLYRRAVSFSEKRWRGRSGREVCGARGKGADAGARQAHNNLACRGRGAGREVIRRQAPFALPDNLSLNSEFYFTAYVMLPMLYNQSESDFATF